MRDIVGIISIVFFWLVLAMILTHVNNDSTLTGLDSSLTGNSSTIIDVQEANINITDVSNTAVGSVSYVDMVFRMITFRIPTSSAIPSAVASILEILSFILVSTLGLLIYRQIRSGSG